MCILYVDDIILWAIHQDNIHDLAMELQELVVDLEQEDDVNGFLGVTLDQNLITGLIYMKHTGLIQRVIEAVGIYYGM